MAKGDPSARTTFAQLQAATVRGSIRASEEQEGVERSQRDRDAIHYHTAEAVRAGNDAASAKKDDPDLVVNVHVPPPLQRARLTSDGSDGSRTERSTPTRQSSVLNGGGGGNTNIGDDNRSMTRAPWSAIGSMRSKSWAGRGAEPLEEGKNHPDPSTRSTADGLEERVARMKWKILIESHARSGARSLDSDPLEGPDSRARARVKLIAERPRAAEAYMRLGLQGDEDMDASRMMEIIDYYCDCARGGTEAIGTGNNVSVAKMDDLVMTMSAMPPVQSVKLTSDANNGSRTGRSASTRQSAVLNGVRGSSGIGGCNGARMRAPWAAIRSPRGIFLAGRSAKLPEEDENGPAPPTRSTVEGLAERVARMKWKVLVESHARSGARFADSDSAEEPDSRARARVKLIVERPRAAEAYIRLGLQGDKDIDASRMIEMIDYYCD